MDRFAKIKSLDATRIANAIEFTRFPSAPASRSDSEEGMLVRAADLIGQLGDPHYLRKANALYYEFEEVGMNKQLGYTSPADLTDLYPKFYLEQRVAAYPKARSATSMSRRADGSGSPICTAMFLARSASLACAAPNAEAGKSRQQDRYRRSDCAPFVVPCFRHDAHLAQHREGRARKLRRCAPSLSAGQSYPRSADLYRPSADSGKGQNKPIHDCIEIRMRAVRRLD